MGVLQCERSGCHNIMCDRYSSKYGYICNECFEELINSGIHTNIQNFMDSKPNRYSRTIVDDYFSEEFKSRHNE